jgi:hypothetical protein
MLVEMEIGGLVFFSGMVGIAEVVKEMAKLFLNVINQFRRVPFLVSIGLASSLFCLVRLSGS